MCEYISMKELWRTTENIEELLKYDEDVSIYNIDVPFSRKNLCCFYQYFEKEIQLYINKNLFKYIF